MSKKGLIDIKRALDDPETRGLTLVELGNWVVETCLFFGTTPDTAYQAASLFIGGIRRSYEKEREG